MKKSELTQLTQIIEHLVAREVRKQLPAIISETFQNMMGKKVVTEQKRAPQPIQEDVEIQENTIEEGPTDFKASLRELFAGTAVMQKAPQPSPTEVRQYTKNPILNQILNETTGDLRSRERLVGAAAFQGGYSPSLSMVPGFNPNAAGGEMQPEADGFLNNIPTMPAGNPVAISRPPVLAEGQTSTHVPLSALPEGVSALDVARHVPLKPEVTKALTKNYSQMLKLMDKKRGNV